MALRLTSPGGELVIGAGYPTVLINDQLRVMDENPVVFEELKTGNTDEILRFAHWGKATGLDMVDIQVDYRGLDETELLPRIAARVLDEIGCPISLDSRNLDALEAALQVIQPYKALINSVTAEPEMLEALLPLAKKYNAALVGMPVGRLYGLPKTAEGRIAEAQVILESAEAAGIPREDIILDGIVLAPAAEPDSFQVTLETLQRYHDELDAATILGIGNSGFGMPDPVYIGLAYLIGAAPYGLDAALVNPGIPGLIETVRAMDFLSGRDPAGRRYLSNYRRKKKAATAQ